MKNIDRIKQMSPKELVKFMRSLQCDKCIYDNTNCQHDMCVEGITKWLEQEGELTIDEIRQEFITYCENKQCFNCEYFAKRCSFGFIIDKFNIINGKITRK